MRVYAIIHNMYIVRKSTSIVESIHHSKVDAYGIHFHKLALLIFYQFEFISHIICTAHDFHTIVSFTRHFRHIATDCNTCLPARGVVEIGTRVRSSGNLDTYYHGL